MPDELVAPLWMRGKSRTLNLMNKRFEERDSFQGKSFNIGR